MYSIGTPADRLGDAGNPTRFPGSTGIAPGLDQQLVLVPFNRLDLLELAFAKHGDELAAVILEPVYYNAGCILPIREFLEGAARADAPSTACC